MARPIGSQLHPFAVFLLGLCALEGFGLMLGTPPPGSINATLPPAAVHLWAFFLFAGAVLALGGMTAPGGIFYEQIGLVMAGGSTAVYAVAIAVTAGPQGAEAAGINLAFGAACVWRWWQLQRLVREARRQS